MKRLYCWRCGIVVPMLSDDELRSITATDKKGHEYIQAFVDGYNALTGESYTNPNAVAHHILSMHGPECKNCSKPLRTPKAARCVECGTPA